MSVARITNTAGLWISPSPLQAPLGSYVLANNCVINSPGIIESRRGFYWLPYELPNTGSGQRSLFSFRGTLLANGDTQVSYNSGTAMVPYDQVFVAPAPFTLRMKGQEAGLNFYFTTYVGIYGIDEVTNQPIAAGLPTGPLPTSTLNATNTTGAPDEGWMPADSISAYVITFFRIDANDTEYEGTPSTPIFVTQPPAFTVDPGDVTTTIGTDEAHIIYPNPGFANGQELVATFDPADTDYISGTYTVSNANDAGFYLVGAAVPPGPATNAHPATFAPGTKNVQVYVQIPTGTLEGQTVLVYRTYNATAQSLGGFPRAQYYLDKEYTLTAGDIVAGYFTYTDLVPDSLLQDPLYTNTDDGEPPDSSLQNDNGRPPFCLDLAEFDQRLWGSNYQELQTFPLALLGVGAPNGLQENDDLTVQLGSARQWRAVAETATPGPGQFRLYTSSSSPGLNVQRTAQALALAINSTTDTVDAFYTSGPDDIPGRLLLRDRNPGASGASAFAVWASRPSAWSPVLNSYNDPDPQLSSTKPQTNGLWFSKQNQPESVPLLNRLSIGPRNCNILRIRPLRDKLFVFTDVAGVYVVSNAYPYQITSVSSTAVLVAPDTLVNFDDAIYALTTQGVVRFTEAGPTILSVPIESELQAMFGTGLELLKYKAFAIGYESYRKYMLAMPTDVADTNNSQVWIYDIVTKAWTRWTKPINAGVVIPETNLLYVTTPQSGKVSIERKNFDRTDYSDEDYPVTITNADENAVTITSTIEPEVGDLLYQSPIARSLVITVTPAGVNTYLLTTKDTITWDISVATIYPGISCLLLNTPIFASGPEERKNFREVTYHFRTPGFSLGYGLFAGDTNPAITQVQFALGGWGEVPFGLFAWEQPGRPVNKRVAIPTPSRRVSFLSVGFALREAQARWQIMGVTPVYENMSERNTK